MAQLTLALITPRAGEWNHRYVVPYGKNWNDTELSSALQKLEYERGTCSGIVLSVVVHQQGGREGTEKLFLYSPDFQALSPAAQQKCRVCMERWFQNRRETMLQSINWPVEGKTQVIPRAELVDLYRELENLLAAGGRSAAAGGKTGEKTKTLSWGGCLMIVAVVGLVLAFNPFQAVKEAVMPSSQPSVEQVRNTPQPKILTDEQFLEQNQPLFQQMFVWTEGKPLNPGNLERALDQVWPEEWNEARPRRLQAFFDEKHPYHAAMTQLCGQIQRNDPFIVFRPLGEGEDWGILQNVRPEAFHACLEACLNWKGDTLWNYQKPAFEARFYWNKNDIDDAKTLRDWVLKSIFTGTEEDQAEKTKYEEAPLKRVLTLALSEDYQSTLQRNVKQKVGEENKAKFMELLRNLTRQDAPKPQPAKAVNPGQPVSVDDLWNDQERPVEQPQTVY